MFLVAVLGAATVGSAAVGATGHPDDAVTRWARRAAYSLDTTVPGDPLNDLAPVRAALRGATVVGLGEALHGVAEVTTLKHRVARLLVEQMGYRTIAWEEDWTTGLEIDAYIRGGPGDADQLVARMSPQYQTAEVGDVLRWLRAFNVGRPDPVRFVGVEHYFTRDSAYALIQDHVAAVAPDQLDELERHLEPIRPQSDDPFEHIGWYAMQDDKEAIVADARAVEDLVARLRHRPGDRAHETALHAARQIVSFYEFHRMEEAQSAPFREQRAAESLRWWQGLTHDRVVYWAATPHTANAATLRIVRPPEDDLRFRSAGSYLHRWYGDGYRSVGFTVDHGAVRLGPTETAALRPPAADWFEEPLGRVDLDQLVLDLRRPVPSSVRR
ncbi:MAG TPA: erythromycin esterase family protein, partial [Iamia sp.]|nr:erythromycin esterase family protein [Iamia sp.]